MLNSLEHHHREELSTVSTVADGIAVKAPGDLTYDLCSKYVDEVVTVTDDEIATAILTLIEQQKLITEGAGAVSAAAALFGKVPLEGKKTVCLLSGGNIDVTILSRIISRGLLKTGRSADFTIELQDKPGQLKEIAAIIADLGANVVAVHHDHSGENTDITACVLNIAMETKDHAHIRQIRDALDSAGYKIVKS